MKKQRRGGATEPRRGLAADTVPDTAMEQAELEEQPETAAEPTVEIVQVSVPLAELKPNEYLNTHVDARLDPDQRVALRRLYNALWQQHAHLASGRHVESAADAVRWLLEAVVEAAVESAES